MAEMHRSRRNLALAVGMAMVLGVAFWARASHATVIVYTDRTAWEAALTSPTFITDAFDTDIASAPQITFASGVVSTNSGGIHCCGDNSVSGGVFENAVGGPGSTSAHLNTWTLPITATAVGFDITFGSTTIVVSVDDGSGPFVVSLYDLLGGTSGFIGLVSAAGFQSLEFSSAPAGAKLFTIDDLALTDAAPKPVPEPAVVLLLAATLLVRAPIAGRRSDPLSSPHRRGG